MGWMAYRKWKECKQQPGTAGPGNMLGCCLIYFHFLWAIHPIRPVQSKSELSRPILDINTVETAYKVYVCPRGNLLYCRPYFISNLNISVNIAFLLTPPAYPHGKSLFTSHFELNS